MGKITFFDRMKNFFASGKVINRAKTDSKKKESYYVDPTILFQAYDDPVIFRAINTIVNKMFSGGYSINPNEGQDYENEIKIAEEFIHKTSFYSKLKSSTRVTLITGNAYQEVAEDVYNLKTAQIKIQEGQEGVESYKQIIDGKEVATIDKERVIHYTIEKNEDDLYGVGLVQRVLFSTSIKRLAEKNLKSAFESGKPRGFWTFTGLSDTEFDTITNLISENKDNIARDLYLRVASNPNREGNAVEYKNLVDTERMNFKELIEHFRQDQITGLMLHPINVGVPEGSNKATAGEENKDLDEAVASFQEEIENIVTKRLFKDILGLNNISFELVSVNKRDTIREMDIATKLSTLPVSANEIREEIGYPKIEEEWADEIRGNPENDPITSDGEFEEEELDEEATKSLKKKQKFENFPRGSAVTQRDEKNLYRIMNNWIREVNVKIKEQLISNSHIFKKQITDPAKIAEKVLTALTVERLQRALRDQMNNLFEKGRNQAGRELNRTFYPDTEAEIFLTNYTLELVRNLEEDTRQKLSNTLRRGMMEGKGVNAIARDISNDLEIERNRAKVIARTETNRAANMSKVQAYKSAGIKKVQWVASIDERTSDICKELNGRIIDLEKGEIFKSEDFQGTSPPAHVNCRSTVIAL